VRGAGDAVARRWDAVRGPGHGGGHPAPARRRDSTYLPGFGSGSAGRGAAGALPPSFLLPSPPPRGSTHNTRRKRKPSRDSCPWKLRCRRAAAEGPNGGCGRRRSAAGGENQLEETRARRDPEWQVAEMLACRSPEESSRDRGPRMRVVER
jgi:hypothetical protein